MNDRCLICRGEKRIRLPLYHPASAVISRDVPISAIPARESSRTYDCPECTKTPDHKLHIVFGEAVTRHRGFDVSAEERHAVQRSAAHEIVDYLLRHELFDFRDVPRGEFETLTQAKLAVVDPRAIKPLEQRVKEATGPALENLADRAHELIAIWGRDVGRTSLTKDEAIRFVREALMEQLRRD